MSHFHLNPQKETPPIANILSDYLSQGAHHRPIAMSAKMRMQLCEGELGSAELIYRKGQFYLHISITEPEPKIAGRRGVWGGDLGVNRVAVTSDRKFEDSL